MNKIKNIHALTSYDCVEMFYVAVKDVVRMPSGGLTFLQVRDHGEGATTGIYQCIASNRYGSIASQNASIELASK